MVFAALSMYMYKFYEYDCHVASLRVCMAKQHCIVPRLESHAVSQISSVYVTKKKTFVVGSQAVMESLWSVRIRSSSHTPVSFTPGLQETSQREGGREGGGEVSEHPSAPAQSALSGLALTARGQVRSFPNISLSSPDVFIPSSSSASSPLETEDYLFSPPAKCFFFLSQV